MSGPFVILRFPVNGDGRESEPATVYKDGFTGALYLDKPQEVERYAQAFGSHEELARERLARSRSVTEFRGAVAPDPPLGTVAAAVASFT